MMKKITILLTLLMLTIFTGACASATSTSTATPVGTETAMDLETPAGTETAITTETPATAQAVSTGTAGATGNVEELIAMVNDFVANGEITGQAENGLLAKLETIQQKLTDGQIDPAINEMGAFVNEVQAQAGKKVSEAAATALITKAQAMAAELMAGVPVTGGQGTAVSTTSQPTDPALANISKPAPMGDKLQHQQQWDGMAQQVAQLVGFSTFDYDLYQLPANTTWEDTLAYYKTEAATAGWSDAPSQTNEMSGGHYAVWSVPNTDGTTNYFVVAQVDTSEGTFTLNIVGNQ